MASITIPTPVQSTGSAIGGITTTEALQQLWGNDWSIEFIDSVYNSSTYRNKFYCYKGLPVLVQFNSSGYLMYVSDTYYPVNKYNAAVDGDNSWFISSSTSYYLNYYEFDTFIILLSYGSSYTSDPFYQFRNDPNSSSETIIIDKTNNEVFSGAKASYRQCISGVMFGWLDNNNPVFSPFTPSQNSDQQYESAPTMGGIRREVSSSDITYYKITAFTGKISTRTYVFSKFPGNSMNTVIHVDDKYFFITPYAMAVKMSAYDGVSNYECACAIAIDVTAEINAQS